MASLAELRRKFEKINNEDLLRKQVSDIIIKDNTIIQAKQDEFERGLRPDGGIIGVYAWPEYENMKAQMNPLANGNVDLRLTGSTYSQLFVEPKNESKFTFKSRDGKWDGLVEQYGKDIKGLNSQTFLDIQIKEYLPIFIKRLKRIINLR